MLLLPALCIASSPIPLSHDLTVISVKDSLGRTWDGGCYTQNSTVKISYEASNPDANAIRVSVVRCNGIVNADHNYMLLEDAVEQRSQDIDIAEINSGETADFDVSVPGRYSLAYCTIDMEGATVQKGHVEFDSLYDDGAWIQGGNAELSSGILSSDNHIWHQFKSNGTGFLEEPGDLIWWECPVTYPYYSGEKWIVPIEYHPVLQMYRIVNPFTGNDGFRDHVPSDDELLCAFHNNVAYTPEAFLFDRENPTWWLLNAEFEYDTYCEPMRTGIVAWHNQNPYCYIAHPYNQNIGYVRYDVCPEQDIKRSDVYVDMPLDDERDASLIVWCPGWITGITGIYEDNESKKEYFTIDGKRADRPGKGFYIVRQGAKSTKVGITNAD